MDGPTVLAVVSLILNVVQQCFLAYLGAKYRQQATIMEEIEAASK